MNMRDLELLESVEQKFLRGDAEYIEHLRSLHTELVMLRKEIDAMQHKMNAMLLTINPGMYERKYGEAAHVEENNHG